MNAGAAVLAQGLQELGAFAESLEAQTNDPSIVTGQQALNNLRQLTDILGATLTMLAMALAGDIGVVSLSDLDNLPETDDIDG